MWYVSITVLLVSWTYYDAVKDFIALVIVNDFDNMLFSYLKNDQISKLIVNGQI